MRFTIITETRTGLTEVVDVSTADEVKEVVDKAKARPEVDRVEIRHQQSGKRIKAFDL